MSERLFHQCHCDGCDSTATFGVRLHLNCCAPGIIDPVHMDCTIKVCDRHKSEQQVREYLLSDHNREVIRTSLMEGEGHPEPDFLTARLEFYPIDRGRSVIHIDGPIAKCDRGDCREPAAYQIKQKFRMLFQRGKGDHLLEVLTNLCVCVEHAKITRAKDLLDKEQRSDTHAWLNARGISMPDFKTSKIEFIPLVRGQRVKPSIFIGDGDTRALLRAVPGK